MSERAAVRLPDFAAGEVGGLTDEVCIRLQAVRFIADRPIHVTSGRRPEDADSEHALGEGVDISDNASGRPVGSRWRHEVLDAAYAVGFRRIGIYDRHLHLGVSKSHAQDVTWIGESQ